MTKSLIRAAALLGAALTLGLAPAFAGGELTDAEQRELRAAFERAIAADIEAELCKIGERKACGEKAACEETGECGLACDCAPALDLLSMTLAKKEGAWDVVAPMIRDRYAAKETTAVERERILDLVSGSYTKTAQKIAHELWESKPKTFGTNHLIALSEAAGYSKAKKAGYGGYEKKEASSFETALAKRAKKDVRAAAFLALRGDDVGFKTRVKAAKAKSLEGGVADLFVASYALKGLGKEELVADAQRRIHDEVLGALDAGETDRARRMACEAEMLYKAMGKAPMLGHLDRKLDWHCAVRAADLTEPDQVFELIESITPL